MEIYFCIIPNNHNKLKKDGMVTACSTIGEKRNIYIVLGGQPEGKRPLGRPRHRWEDNIKTVLREIVWGGMKLISGSR
jgi:hypothetical protein